MFDNSLSSSSGFLWAQTKLTVCLAMIIRQLLDSKVQTYFRSRRTAVTVLLSKLILTKKISKIFHLSDETAGGEEIADVVFGFAIIQTRQPQTCTVRSRQVICIYCQLVTNPSDFHIGSNEYESKT